MVNRVREHREEIPLSQEALARKAGVSLGTVSRIERGLFSPRLETASALARALGVSRESLFPEEEGAA